MQTTRLQSYIDAHEVQQALILKCRERITIIEDVKKIDDVDYIPSNACLCCSVKRALSFTRLGIIIGASLLFIWGVIASYVIGKKPWFSDSNKTASILLIIFLSISGVFSLIMFILWVRRPRKVIVTQKTYVLNTNVELDKVVPSIETIGEDIRKYVESAFNKYIQEQMPLITKQCVTMEKKKLEYPVETMISDSHTIIKDIGEDSYNSIFINGAATLGRYVS
jgi:hypothetical protein